jgi:uncharacterized membrane protein
MSGTESEHFSYLVLRAQQSTRVRGNGKMESTATMAFCTHCGNSIGGQDAFCGNCGTPQVAGAAPPRPAATSGAQPGAGADPLAGLSSNTASMLCYVPGLGWLMSIVILASERFRREPRSRFHAFQGLYLFVAYLIVDRVLRPIFPWGWWTITNPIRLLELAILIGWIYMMITTHRGETVKLPLIGDLAEKSADEQQG